MANVIRLNKAESIERLRNKLPAARENSSGISASKYSGVLTVKEDPAAYQKQIRDEWN